MLRSPGTYSLINLCYTLTQTDSPVERSFALCTWPKLALAIGFSSNSEKTSSIGFYNSVSRIFLTSLNGVVGAFIHIGSNTSKYSSGTKL